MYAVFGAGGFIGGHLVQQLEAQGVTVVASDIKPFHEWYQLPRSGNNFVVDLTSIDQARLAAEGCTRIYNLAADMGGMGFIANHKAECMLTVLTSTNALTVAKENNMEKLFYASSACVYPGYRQEGADVPALKESDAYPADPEDGYGWEKLFTERMCRHFYEDFGLETRIARFHNVYGPYGTYDGGREKAPAAICRKVIEAKLSGNHSIDIWGDGEQTRSFMYIEDCLDGIDRITESDFRDPINLGSSELVTINQLVDVVEDIAKIQVERHYQLDKPQGVRGRNSDNTLIKKVFDWEPSISLRIGIQQTYEWIWNEMTHGEL